MKAAKVIATAALFAGFATNTMAENRIPAELAEEISPGYRALDVDATSGAQFVWVQRIEGRDSAGNNHVLFDDMNGALLPLEQLHKAERLINPVEVSNKGAYRELQLTLAGNMLSVGRNGMERSALPEGISRQLKLQGVLEVSRFEVSSNGMSLQAADNAQLALLNR